MLLGFLNFLMMNILQLLFLSLVSQYELLNMQLILLFYILACYFHLFLEYLHFYFFYFQLTFIFLLHIIQLALFVPLIVYLYLVFIFPKLQFMSCYSFLEFQFPFLNLLIMPLSLHLNLLTQFFGCFLTLHTRQQFVLREILVQFLQLELFIRKHSFQSSHLFILKTSHKFKLAVVVMLQTVELQFTIGSFIVYMKAEQVVLGVVDFLVEPFWFESGWRWRAVLLFRRVIRQHSRYQQIFITLLKKIQSLKQKTNKPIFLYNVCIWSECQSDNFFKPTLLNFTQCEQMIELLKPKRLFFRPNISHCEIQSRYNYNFINKMSRNYDWNTDKENKYDLDSNQVRLKPYAVTNSVLRRKIDDNLTLAERDRTNQPQHIDLYKQQNYKIDQSYTGSNKRDNARKRGFDMRVTNIDNINEKIVGLLNMVKKDKATERTQTRDVSRFDEIQGKERDQTPKKDFSDKKKSFSKSNNASGKKYLNQEPKMTKFGEPKVQEYQKKRVISVLDQVDENQTNQSQNIRQLRISNFEEERKKRENQATKYTPNRRKKQQDSSLVDESFRQKQSKRFDLKVAARMRQQIAQKSTKSQYQKMDIEKMIEQRRKQRFTYADNDRGLSPSVTTNARSQIKGRDNKQGQIKYNRQKESPIVAVKNQFTYNQNISDQSRSKVRNSPSPAQNHQSRKSDYFNFSKLSYVQVEPFRQQRQTTNTKIIDDQLNKIKNKIMQSQTNKKKLEKFNPGSSVQKENCKTHTCRIADSISSQVEYDSNLRAFRETFCKMPGQSKWSQLQNISKQKGLNFRGEQLRQLINIGPDQHNPFISQKTGISMQQFVTLLVAAQKNWEHCVIKCASGRSLKGENFQISDLDLSGKGYLALQDIVCFVNLYSNTFYRNRDLALAMRRLQMWQGQGRKGGIQYQTFMQALVS